VPLTIPARKSLTAGLIFLERWRDVKDQLYSAVDSPYEESVVTEAVNVMIDETFAACTDCVFRTVDEYALWSLMMKDIIAGSLKCQLRIVGMLE
jgi:hypothetical protein